MSFRIISLLFVCSFAGAAETVVPVYEEPFHRLVADVRDFKILDILIPPDQTTQFHRHAEPTFYITLNRTKIRTQTLGQEWSTSASAIAEPGSVSHNDEAREKPFEHRVNNVGNEDFRLILISNDRVTRAAPDLDVMPSMPGVPGIDSQYFTQSKIFLGPRERYDWGGVPHKVIFVLVTDTHVVVRSNRVRDFAWGMHDPGDFEYVNTEQGFSFENRSDEPAIIIAVAVR